MKSPLFEEFMRDSSELSAEDMSGMPPEAFGSLAVAASEYYLGRAMTSDSEQMMATKMFAIGVWWARRQKTN